MRQILLPLALAAATQAQLVTFSAGSPAKAADVNGNFAYLAARLDSLTKALASKDTVIASLKASSSWGDSLKELGKRLDAGIPKGTIAGFMTAPGNDSYLPGSNQTWIIAAGQNDENGVKIPDLRGQFLRGIDLTVTGAKDTAYDPDDKRASGSQQADAFQGHWHQNTDASHTTLYRYGAGSAGTGSGFAAGKTDTDVNSFVGIIIKTPVSDRVNGTPRTASETRPKNVAIYWYIKVK